MARVYVETSLVSSCVTTRRDPASVYRRDLSRDWWTSQSPRHHVLCAVHVAAACVHGMEYLLTWNVRHLANPNKLAHLSTVCLRLGVVPPRILTPEFLWEAEHDDGSFLP